MYDLMYVRKDSVPKGTCVLQVISALAHTISVLIRGQAQGSDSFSIYLLPGSLSQILALLYSFTFLT